MATSNSAKGARSEARLTIGCSEVRPARVPALHPRRRQGQQRERERQGDDSGAPESHASDRFW